LYFFSKKNPEDENTTKSTGTVDGSEVPFPTTWVGAKHPNNGISTTFTSTGELIPDFWLPSNKSK